MDSRRVAPLIGIVASLAVLVTLIYPYLGPGGGAGVYFDSGVFNPLVAGLLALVTIIVLAAGQQDRTDPGFAAGVGIVFGFAILAILLVWAVTVRVDTVAIAPIHRWLTVAVAAPIPAGAVWFARSLGLL
jgi:hypothetical protein